MRGIVEGFHGEPWSHEARLQVLALAARHGFDTYVYAPKDEPKHRTRWRELYDGEEAARFRELGQAAAAAGIRLVYSVHPGLDMRFSDGDDFHALSGKVAQMRGFGFDGAMLSFDDTAPTLGEIDARRFRGEPGAAHAYLANWLHREQQTIREPFHLMLVPTECCGTVASPYLAALDDLLNAEIDVVWMGPAVLCERITAAEARAFARCVGRRPVLWDNYPVNDCNPRRLFLGPVTGRAADLPQALAGVLVNSMRQARASLVPLLTYAAYLRDPVRYEPEAALRAAVAEVGGPAAASLERLVSFQRQSHLDPRRQPAARLMERLSSAAAAGGAVPEQVEAELSALEGLPDALAGAAVAGLADEVAAWGVKLARAAALVRGALTGGDRAALTVQLGDLRADATEIGEPLLALAGSLLRAEPARVGHG